MRLPTSVGFVIACGCAVPTTAPADAGPFKLPTYAYVIGAIQDETGDARTAFGADLDSDVMPAPGSCADTPDFVDPYDPTNTHVDNRLSLLLPMLGTTTDPDAAGESIRDQIARGTLLIALEVSGVESFAIDPQVFVRVVLAERPTSAACAAHATNVSCGADVMNGCSWLASGACTGVQPSTACATHTDEASCAADVRDACSWSIPNNACVGIASDQYLRTMMELGNATGTIQRGRIAFSIDQLALPVQFPLPDGNRVLRLRSTRFVADVTASGLTRGEFGGTLSVVDLASQITYCPGAGNCGPSTLAMSSGADQWPVPDTRTSCAAHGDLASCQADPAYCEWVGSCRGYAAGTLCLGISAGFGFEAVSAILD